MIRKCTQGEIEDIYSVVNDAAQAYKGIIPADRWKEPYMPMDELKHEIESGVVFWGYEEEGRLLGIMGLQSLAEVALIRHSYVLTARQNQGLGQKLLTHLKVLATQPLLVGTWKAAHWAVRFYEKHGFKLVSRKEKDRLLRKYWSIPERQIETSVVLADSNWFQTQ